MGIYKIESFVAHIS